VSASSKGCAIFRGHLRIGSGSDFHDVFFGTRRGQVLAEAALARFSTADRPTELVSQALSAVAQFRDSSFPSRVKQNKKKPVMM
jgi:hypothetical protein